MCIFFCSRGSPRPSASFVKRESKPGPGKNYEFGIRLFQKTKLTKILKTGFQNMAFQQAEKTATGPPPVPLTRSSTTSAPPVNMDCFVEIMTRQWSHEVETLKNPSKIAVDQLLDLLYCHRPHAEEKKQELPLFSAIQTQRRITQNNCEDKRNKFEQIHNS